MAALGTYLDHLRANDYRTEDTEAKIGQNTLAQLLCPTSVGVRITIFVQTKNACKSSKYMHLSHRREFFMTRRFSPETIIWVASHIALVFLGFLVTYVEYFNQVLGKDVAVGIGASLIAAGVTGISLFIYVRASDGTREKIRLITVAGISGAFPTRQVRIRHEYDVRVDRGKKIDIIGFGLSSFREDHLSDFVSWSASKQFRILVLDPTFPNVKNSYSTQRDKEERNSPGEIKSNIDKFISDVSNLEGLNRENFQVRKMKALPSINMFRIDHEIFWGPYLMSDQSRNMPTLLVQKGGFLYDLLRKHFDEIWENEMLAQDIFAVQ